MRNISSVENEIMDAKTIHEVGGDPGERHIRGAVGAAVNESSNLRTSLAHTHCTLDIILYLELGGMHVSHAHIYAYFHHTTHPILLLELGVGRDHGERDIRGSVGAAVDESGNLGPLPHSRRDIGHRARLGALVGDGPIRGDAINVDAVRALESV